MVDSGTRVEIGRIEIGRIGISGAPAAMRDGAAFGRALEAALTRALMQVQAGAAGIGAGRIEVGALKVRLRHDAGTGEIAAAVAATIADAAREG